MDIFSQSILLTREYFFKEGEAQDDEGNFKIRKIFGACGKHGINKKSIQHFSCKD
jgi:hypothetical protein